MIEVPGGAFAMGSPASEAGRSQDEGPAREVALADAFAIGVREVTYAEWEACVGGRRLRRPTCRRTGAGAAAGSR